MEPNPVMYKKLTAKREGDICINAGIAFDEKAEADFYVFPEKFHGLNTFSKAEADFWAETGNEEIGKHKPERIIKIQLININKVMEKYFSPHPNFISVDVEGLDLEIVKTIDFDKYKPEVFCLETLGFAVGNKEIKKSNIVDFFRDKGYFVYADTYINTIFCRKAVYKNLVDQI